MTPAPLVFRADNGRGMGWYRWASEGPLEGPFASEAEATGAPRATRATVTPAKLVRGPTPYGWRLVDGGREVAPEEQATIARARALRDSGLTLTAAADALASEGRFARNGRPFAPAQVSKMIARSSTPKGRAVLGMLGAFDAATRMPTPNQDNETQ